MGDDKRDPPIEPLDYLYGVKVVDIGDYRVARGKTRRPFSGCNHKQLVYDQQERRIWCKDCERDLEPFDAFLNLVDGFNAGLITLKAKQKTLDDALSFQTRTLAAKAIDEAWRSKTMVPACPHCGNGLFPEHFKNGVHGMLGKDYAAARIKKRTTPPTEE